MDIPLLFTLSVTAFLAFVAGYMAGFARAIGKKVKL